MSDTTADPGHPPDDLLRAYAGGRLSAAEAGPVEAHLVRCEACVTLLETLSADDPLAARLREAAGADATRDYHPPGSGEPARAAGARVGPYELVERLGAGGMGEVWLARQERPVRREVALKLVRSHFSGRHVLARFEAERQALALMDHPNIARVLDAGTAPDGGPYFVMEYVRGVPINRYCDDARLSPRDRLELFVPVCRAVQHAHQKGVIHRDLKPSNILVAEADGRPVPKVIDFGVAKATSGERLTDRTLVTEVGQVVGTLEYMAPEQADPGNLDIDTRADVYALGVVLYELLAGSPPFSAKQPPAAGLAEMLRVIREDEPPRPSTKLSSSGELAVIAARRGTEPRRLTGMVRGDLDWVVMKCLEKGRGRRYDSAEALARDVERYLADKPAEAGPPSRWYRLRKLARRHKALVGGVLGVIAALVVGLIGTILFAARAEHNARQAQANARVAEHNARAAQEEERLARYQTYLARLTAAGGALQNHDVAEAAHQLDQAPPELRGWEWRHLRARLDDSSAELRAPARSFIFLFGGPGGLRVATVAADVRVTDPDGRERLAFPFEPDRYVDLAQARGDVWVAGDPGPGAVRLRDSAGRVRCLVADPDCASPLRVAVSPDGSRVAVAWDTTPWGRWGVAVYETGSGKRGASCGRHEGGVWGFDFSPDGRQLASCGEDKRACVWDAATGALVAEMRGHASKVHRVVFRGDGARLLTTSADGTVRQWDARTGREVEPPFERHTGEVLAAAYSPDGRLIASGGTDRAVRVWQAAGRQEVAVLHGHTRDVTGLAFGPDGRRLASASQTVEWWHGDGTVRFWEVGAGPPVLRGHTSYVYPVAYSPDGRWIASGSWDRTARLWDARTGECRAVLGHPGTVNSLAFAPDGSWLATACDGDDGLRVWGVADAAPRRTIEGPGVSRVGVAVSPDGTRVAAFDAVRNLGVYDVATGRPVASGKGGVLAYSPDGRWLAGAGEDARVLCLWDARTLEPVARFTGHTGGITSVAFSPDARRLASAGGGDDRTVRVWDVGGGPARVLAGHTGEVFAVAFHPGGTRVASAGRDRDVWLWDPETGERVIRLAGHANYVWSLAFSPDGKTLASGSGDGTVRLWDTEPPRVRHRARREAEALRPEAGRLVERLSRELGGLLRRAVLGAVLRSGKAGSGNPP